MHRDIKSFSDLTDIDTDELLEVSVKLKRHGGVNFIFTINDDEFTDLCFAKRYPLGTVLRFECKLIDFVENSGAIEIEMVSVNGKQILPVYLHQAMPQTSYIAFAGSWRFELSKPFYPWYHELTGQGWIA